jgi:hypothetical protein
MLNAHFLQAARNVLPVRPWLGSSNWSSASLVVSGSRAVEKHDTMPGFEWAQGPDRDMAPRQLPTAGIFSRICSLVSGGASDRNFRPGPAKWPSAWSSIRPQRLHVRVLEAPAHWVERGWSRPHRTIRPVPQFFIWSRYWDEGGTTKSSIIEGTTDTNSDHEDAPDTRISHSSVFASEPNFNAAQVVVPSSETDCIDHCYHGVLNLLIDTKKRLRIEFRLENQSEDSEPANPKPCYDDITTIVT